MLILYLQQRLIKLERERERERERDDSDGERKRKRAALKCLAAYTNKLIHMFAM